MSKIEAINKKLSDNPTLVHPEVKNLLAMFSKLDALEDDITKILPLIGTGDTEIGEVLKEIERAKDNIEAVIILPEPYISEFENDSD